MPDPIFQLVSARFKFHLVEIVKPGKALNWSV